jgi:bifunctional non-homologous end joining protein LigD
VLSLAIYGSTAGSATVNVMVQRVSLNPKPQPRFIEPMECRRVAKLPEGEDWVYEIKQDGYRAIALMDGSSAMLYSMSGQDYSSQFRQIVFALQTLRQGNLVLDGEIVALDENGRASFQELQNRRTSRRPIVYYVFDVLHQRGATLSICRSTKEEKCSMA